jgi:predicted HicB family RNase H-like nuclease
MAKPNKAHAIHETSTLSGRSVAVDLATNRRVKSGSQRSAATQTRPRDLVSRNSAEDYLYSVVWSPEDEAFIGRVLEFPSLAAHGETQEKALREIRAVVGYALEDLDDNREPAPEPLSKRPFSGTLNLRMPKHLHRQLAIEAAQEGVSLNQWINTKLAAFLRYSPMPARGTS